MDWAAMSALSVSRPCYQCSPPDAPAVSATGRVVARRAGEGAELRCRPGFTHIAGGPGADRPGVRPLGSRTRSRRRLARLTAHSGDPKFPTLKKAWRTDRKSGV